MKTVPGNFKNLMSKLGEKLRIRKGMVAIVVIALAFQMYFVRELVAAELLFGLGFAVLLAFAGLFYVIGTISERSLDWTEAGVRFIADSARRGYASLEEVSRKPFRHPRSESAQ